MAALLSVGRRRVKDVWMVEGLSAPVLDEIAELAKRRGVPLRRVSRDRLDARATTAAPQGVLARADPLQEVDLDQLLPPAPASTGGERPFLLALDGVTDPQNLGALLRSAETAGVSGVVLPRHRSAHITATVAKAAAGAIESLPLALVAGVPAALSRAREAGCWTVGLAADADDSLFDLGVASETVLVVVGAEGAGLSRLARERCDVVVRIPMRGSVSSLNVAVAGALALFEVRRRRDGRAKDHDRPIDTPARHG